MLTNVSHGDRSGHVDLASLGCAPIKKEGGSFIRGTQESDRAAPLAFTEIEVRAGAVLLKHENVLEHPRLPLRCLSNRSRDRIRKRSPHHPIRHRCNIHHSILPLSTTQVQGIVGTGILPRCCHKSLAPFTENEKTLAIIAPQNFRRQRSWRLGKRLTVIRPYRNFGAFCSLAERTENASLCQSE